MRNIVGFNIDKVSGNILAALITVDLTRTDPKVLLRYLGKDGAEAFLAYHRVDTNSGFATCA
jgi:hypothetical protein